MIKYMNHPWMNNSREEKTSGWIQSRNKQEIREKYFEEKNRLENKNSTEQKKKNDDENGNNAKTHRMETGSKHTYSK